MIYGAIAKLETFTDKFVSFVKVTTTDGHIGWGQLSNYNADITPHSANLSLVTICTMHLLGAISNAGKYLEFSIEGRDYYPWQENLFLGDPFAVQDGMVEIPAGPGWGVEVNPQWLAKADRQVSTL